MFSVESGAVGGLEKAVAVTSLSSAESCSCDIFVISGPSHLPISDAVALLLLFFPVCADPNELGFLVGDFFNQLSRIFV